MNSAELEAIRARAECLAGREQVQQAYDRMAGEISAAIGSDNPVLVAVMSGGLVPAGELFTRLDFPVELDYLHATRYQGETRGSDELSWLARPRTPLAGRTVLVVDDILDEGVTLAEILASCRREGARRVLSAVLVEKRHARKPRNLKADFTGLMLPDRYLFGCGMDYHGYWRNLPAIYALAAADEAG
ncbi:MAG TPA: hypoxanthine-guanine phosphoribosyltransferase [Gammaproteobacteria bacterium]|nr:hypoxanthine-guanine phosphoribosyltransferase [Gammaproteobacteria bacterium]